MFQRHRLLPPESRRCAESGAVDGQAGGAGAPGGRHGVRAECAPHGGAPLARRPGVADPVRGRPRHRHGGGGAVGEGHGGGASAAVDAHGGQPLAAAALHLGEALADGLGGVGGRAVDAEVEVHHHQHGSVERAHGRVNHVA